MNSLPHNPGELVVLGGGPAGLAAGYFAKKNGCAFSIYEAGERVGGNCVTLQRGNFRFDSGAHRLHNKDPEITAEIAQLLGDELQKVEVPSQIFHRDTFIDFPLSPFNLLMSLGPITCSKAAVELVRSRMAGAPTDDSFEKFALYTYGRTIADKFLLNYSQKLWGLPCARLSRRIAGKRLEGLNARTFLKEMFLGKKAKTEHLESMNFYYPKRGYGTIAEHLERFCGKEHIHLNSRVTKLKHDGRRITTVEINGKDIVPAADKHIVGTLPVSLICEMLDPALPDEILAVARSLRFRHMILIVLMLERPSVSNNATIYFPDPDCLFTRAYEPRNRCRTMAPEGQTSLCLEIPAQLDDDHWRLPDEALIERVSRQLCDYRLIKHKEIIDKCVYRFKFAYPVLESGYEQKIAPVFRHLASFGNLSLSGRNGKYVYSWLHDMMRFGKEIVEEHMAATAKRGRAVAG
jgi:protoporphyrinogen oxidase